MYNREGNLWVFIQNNNFLLQEKIETNGNPENETLTD